MKKIAENRIFRSLLLIVFSTPAFASQTVQQCLNAAGTNGVCTLPSSYSETITSTIKMSSGQRLRCSGGTLTLGANVAMFNLNAPGVTVENCSINQNKASFPNNDAFLVSAASITIQGNSLSNVGNAAISANGASDLTITNNRISGGTIDVIHLVSVQGARISGNSFTNILGNGIYGEQNTQNISVTDNRMMDGGGTAQHQMIGFRSGAAGSIVSGITIKGNVIQNGASYCVAMSSSGGLAPTGIVISGNNCTQNVVSSSTAFGGYVINGVTTPVIAGNSYVNQTSALAAHGIDLTGGHGATCSGNRLMGAQLNVLQYQTIVSANNLTDGYIFMSTSNGFQLNNNSLSNNIIDNSSGRVAMGIWVQCNTANVNCSGNKIEGNQLIGNNLSGVRPPLTLENDAWNTGGKMDSSSVLGNTFVNWPSNDCFSAWGGGKGVTNTVIANNVGCAALSDH